jgi:hypothetical protein
VRLIADQFVIAGDWTEPVEFAIDSTDEALNRSVETSQNTNVAVTVLSDTPAGDPSIASIVSDPAHGTATISEDGNLVYTPNADFTGEDAFRYTLTSASGDRRTGTVSVLVTLPQVVAAANELPPADYASDTRLFPADTLSASGSDKANVSSLTNFISFDPDEMSKLRFKHHAKMSHPRAAQNWRLSVSQRHRSSDNSSR